MNNVIDMVIVDIQKFRGQVWANATAHTFNSGCGRVEVLGSERLATDPDDRDLTETFRALGLRTAVAPGEWPALHEGVTCDEDPRAPWAYGEAPEQAGTYGGDLLGLTGV